MIYLEYTILLLLFLIGYFFITSFIGYDRQVRNIAGAFPIGCCLWASISLLSDALPFVPKSVYGFYMPVALMMILLILIITLLISLNRYQICWQNCLAILCGVLLISFLYWLFNQINISIITGDSLHQLHPQNGLNGMRNVRGFNTTHAALAGLVGQDRYFFSYHPLFSLSLLILLGECAFFEIKTETNKLSIALWASIIGPLLLASCFMTAINVFYVNNHILFAALIMIALSLFSQNNNRNNNDSRQEFFIILLAVIVVSFLGLLRLEGNFVAMILLIIMLGHPEVNHRVRFKALLGFALISTPFQLFLIFNTAGKVSSENFALIFLSIWLLPIAYYSNKPDILSHIQNQAHKYIVLILGACITFFFVIGYNKMKNRLSWELQNMLDESYWGFTYQSISCALVIIIGLRIFHPSPQNNVANPKLDLILLFFISSLLSILFMLNFHGSHPGWTSSQNRMLIHFLPVVILWITTQAGLGLGRNGDSTEIN